MDVNTCWFLGAVGFTALVTVAGVLAGRGTPGAARAAIGAAVAWMLSWAWLVHHPEVALEFIPVGWLSRTEGFGGVPAFMFLLGVVWSRSQIVRQRILVGWAAVFGCIYFLNGSLWLVQDTPALVMGNTYEPRGTVLQSQDYSCVAASCATALNLLGRPSSEAELAYLTDTRPGTGATVLRALRGLNERLDGGGLRARLYGIVAEAVPLIPLPALTALQYEPGRRHMVVILACDSERVWMIDPMFGVSETDHRSFAEVFTGQVIVFEGARDGGFSKRVLRQSGLISVPLPR